MITRLCIAGTALLTLCLAGLELSERASGDLVLFHDPATSAASLAEEGRWAEAEIIAGFALSRPDLGERQGAEEILHRSNEELDSFRGQLERFTLGAVTGEPTDMPSMLGSLSLDLFMIGDIRDIAVQGWKEWSEGTGDGVILALSAIGLTTTLAPQLDWAPALLKALKRSGALTREFVQFLSRTARQASATGDYNKLTRIIGDFGQAAGRLGPGPLRGVMSSVDDAHDLTRVARASEVDPRSTYVLARLFGKDGVKAIDMDGRNVGKVAGSIKAGSRITKIAKKTTGSLPAIWLVIIMAVSLLALMATAYPGKRRVKYTTRTDTGHAPDPFGVTPLRETQPTDIPPPGQPGAE